MASYRGSVLSDLLLSVASAILSPLPATPAPKPATRSWTDWLSALSAPAMVCLTGGIVWLGWVQYTVSNGQLRVMQRQLDDAEIKDSASVVMRHFAISGFPDHMIANFDVSNIGPTRAEMVTVIPTFRWGPRGPQTIGTLSDPKNESFYQPNEFGFTLAPEELRHVDIPVRWIDPSKAPENMRASLPTAAQPTSEDFTSVVMITAAYKTIFGRVEHVGDCAVYQQQQFRHCWGDSSQRLGGETAP